MPQFQRGVYEPGEDVRVFDGSEDEEDAEGSRLPLLIVLALLVLAMFGGVVWLAYTQGVARGRTETPVIAAASGPARVAPANPGGAEQPYKGFKIYEQPAPPDDDVAANAPALSPPPATKPAIVASAPPPAATPPAAALTPAPAPKPVAAPPKQTAAAPAKPVAPPKPVTAAPPPATAAEPATAAPRALASVAPPAAKPAGASGGYVLQIGAYKSQADADTAWNAYKRSHAALLAGYGPDVQKADLGDKGTWYRLRIAGFADKDAASALCDRLKAEQGACFLGR